MIRGYILLFLLFSLFLTGATNAQEADTPEALLADAYHLLYDEGNDVDAVPIFRQVADQYPSTEHAFEALIMLAQYDYTLEAQQAAFQEIIDTFPGTRYASRARLGLLSHSHTWDFITTEEYIQARSDLAVEWGGPSIEEILTGNNLEQKTETISTLDEDNLWNLVDTYRGIWVTIGRGTPGNPNLEDALTITKYLRRTFEPLLPDYDGMDSVTLALGPKRIQFSNQEKQYADPIVTFLSPTAGSTTGPLPTIQAEAHSGDLGFAQISLSDMKVTLDGSDVKRAAKFDSSYGEIQAGVPFETIILEYTPQTPLSPGRHEFKLEVPVIKYSGSGPGKTTKTLEFYVSGEVNQSLTLPTTKDSTLRAQKPHRNEGANPRLFLSHRLEERGKSQNPIVGFDLANVDLTGLTKATLVLNVQDCDLPRRWGKNGRYIEAYPVNTPWVEGNGNKYRVDRGNGKTKGQGPGVTWFMATDDKIQNNRPDGTGQWSGARSAIGPATAPPLLLVNRQTGPVEFDVTQDVLTGFEDGWILKKQDESKFGNIRFYSKEGAAQAGDINLAPKLVLEFGGSVAADDRVNRSGSLLSRLGLGSFGLKPKTSGSELPTLRERLQHNPALAFVGESMIGSVAGPNPMIGLASRAVYRAWLA